LKYENMSIAMTLFYIHETQMTTCKMNENHNGDYALISPKIITEI